MGDKESSAEETRWQSGRHCGEAAHHKLRRDSWKASAWHASQKVREAGVCCTCNQGVDPVAPKRSL